MNILGKLKLAGGMLLLLSGCGGSDAVDDQTSVGISGAVQKGPFIVGSTVTINYLSDRGENTDSTIITSTKDDLGSFVFSTDTDGLVQLSATGYYRNEITGELSQGTLTLRSLYNVSVEEEQQAYINLLTHITSNRVLNLIKGEGLSYAAALSQAETEFLLSFSDVVQNLTEGSFTTLSIFENQTTSGSAYLLAVSSIMYQYAIQFGQNNSTNPDAELSLLVNQLEADFSDNGVIDNSLMLESLRNTIPGINPVQITENINAWIDGNVDYVAADINEYLDTDLDGIYNVFDLDDDNDGMVDNDDPLPYNPGFVVSNQEIVANEDTSITIAISSNNPLNTVTSLEVTYLPENGQLLGDYPELTYAPNVNYSGVDQFKYILSQGTLLSEEVTVQIIVQPINDAPAISGNPLSDIIAFTNYSFTPVVLNIENDQLVFSIENMPAWAEFSEITGELSGKPNNGHIGDFEDIIVTVSDGDLTATMDPFSITVLGNPWSKLTSMPTARTPAAASIGSKIYVSGGLNGRTVLEVYDTNSNLWETKASFQNGRWLHSSHALKGEIYVIGGDHISTLSSVEKYDVETDSWTDVASLITARSGHASCVYHGRIYVFGGYTSTSHSNYTATVEEYNPVTDTWAAKTPMSKGNAGMSCATRNDKIYILSGAENSTSFEVYDPNLDAWEGGGLVNTERRYGATASTVEGNIYVIGGYNYLDSVEMFDDVASTWIVKTPMPEGRHNMGTAEVDNKIYLFGGRMKNSSTTNLVEVYEPLLDQ